MVTVGVLLLLLIGVTHGEISFIYFILFFLAFYCERILFLCSRNKNPFLKKALTLLVKKASLFFKALVCFGFHVST